jgi:hypothetical protein
MKFEPGDIIRFTYQHQDVDASTGDKFKEVLVLHPFWGNKIHGIDLKRLSPAERTVLEAILDPEQADKPHRLPMVNDIRRKMDPISLIRNPMVFYTRFVKPFLRHKDAYRTYIPRLMSGITKVRGASVKTGKKPIENPLFGPKPGQQQAQQPAAQPKAKTPIDIMQQNAKNKGLK